MAEAVSAPARLYFLFATPSWSSPVARRKHAKCRAPSFQTANGLNTRNHFLAGNFQRCSISAARSAHTAASGR